MSQKSIRIFSTEKDKYLKRFEAAAKELNLEVVTYHYEKFSFANDRLTYRGRKSFSDFDQNELVFFRRCDYENKKQYFWLRLLASLARDSGARVLNTDFMVNFPLHSGKLFQAAYFSAKKIPHVPTYRLNRKLKEESFPMIIKKRYGAFGQDSQVVEDRDQFLAAKKNIKNLNNFIIQPFYPLEKDVRVLILNNKIVGSVLRSVRIKNSKEIKVKVVSEHKLNAIEQSIVDQLLQNFDLDLAGIDLFTAKNGKTWLGEINFFPNFLGFMNVTNQDVFRLILSSFL